MIRQRISHKGSYSKQSTIVLTGKTEFKPGDMRQFLSKMNTLASYKQSSMYYQGYDTEFQLDFYNIRGLNYADTFESPLTPVIIL